MRKEALVGLLWANPPVHHIPWDAPSIFAAAFLGSGSWASQYDIPLTWSFQSLYSNSETKNIFSQIVYRKNNTWQKKDRFYAIWTSYCYIYHSFVGLGARIPKKNHPEGWRIFPRNGRVGFPCLMWKPKSLLHLLYPGNRVSSWYISPCFPF